MDLGYAGKSALVTGASKGIGAGVAEALAAEGCSTIHIAARDEARLGEVARRLQSQYSVTVKIHPVDLRDAAQLARLHQQCGPLDVLVNNAGDIPGGTLDKVDATTWRHAWDLKVYGYIDLTRLVYADMKSRGRGAIVNIIGIAAERCHADYIVGSAGNGALAAFTRALGGRSLDDGIRVVGVHPGPVETDRIVAVSKQRAEAKYGDAARYVDMMAHYPLGRTAKVVEVAQPVVFLASERCSYISGAILNIEGGHTAGHKR